MQASKDREIALKTKVSYRQGLVAGYGRCLDDLVVLARKRLDVWTILEALQQYLDGPLSEWAEGGESGAESFARVGSNDEAEEPPCKRGTTKGA
jgi:hypothetical protein